MISAHQILPTCLDQQYSVWLLRLTTLSPGRGVPEARWLRTEGLHQEEQELHRCRLLEFSEIHRLRPVELLPQNLVRCHLLVHRVGQIHCQWQMRVELGRVDDDLAEAEAHLQVQAEAFPLRLHHVALWLLGFRRLTSYTLHRWCESERRPCVCVCKRCTYV